MKTLILIAIVAMLTGCGQEKLELLPIIENESMEAEIASIQDMVEDVTGELDFPIVLVEKFSNDQEKTFTVGRCNKVNGEALRVEISQSKWFWLTDDMKIALIAHEVVHCKFKVLHTDHVEDEFKLMNPMLDDSAKCVTEFGVAFCINEALVDVKIK